MKLKLFKAKKIWKRKTLNYNNPKKVAQLAIYMIYVSPKYRFIQK